MSFDPKTATLAQAKAWLAEFYLSGKGVDCPCCTQRVQRYKRKLNSGMACVLVHIYRATDALKPTDGWLHVSRTLAARKVAAADKEYSKLRFWGLIEQHPGNVDPDASTPHSGLWRITNPGRLFVENKLSVPRHVYVFKNEVRPAPKDDVPEQTNIVKALGDDFNYTELLGGA